MNYTTLTLIPAIQYGNASGDYAGGNVYVGTAVPAAAYYGGQTAIQTLLANVSSFQGNISIIATLNDIREQAAWFEIANVIASSNVTSNAITQITSNAITGNFSWLQATLTDFSAGNVNTVNVSY